MSCTTCGDQCCSHGVDVDQDRVGRILGELRLRGAMELAPERWFGDEVFEDAEFPSGRYRRTAVVDGACVFLNRRGRGCLIHSCCLEHGIEYHTLKPMVSALFPLTYDLGLLHPSGDAVSGELVCLGEGESLYRGGREELRYYFGEALVAELDALCERVMEGLGGTVASMLEEHLGSGELE